jgi:hypothetical protein
MQTQSQKKKKMEKKIQKKLFVRVVAPKTISHFGEILQPIFHLKKPLFECQLTHYFKELF